MSRRAVMTIIPVMTVLLMLACAVGPNQIAKDPTGTPAARAVMTVLPQDNPVMTTQGTQAPQVTVTALQALNVRARPGTTARVIGALYSGDGVTLAGVCIDNWAGIVWQDGRAWVSARYLSNSVCLSYP